VSAPLMLPAERERLLANGRLSAAGEELDPLPIVKLFTPDANASWLLTELDPDDPSVAFGLADLGLGMPELGYISLAELAGIRGHLGLPVERDERFRPGKPLSAYAAEARRTGRITA